MKAEFVLNGRRDEILLIADSDREIEDLKRWDKCVVSARFNYGNSSIYTDQTLLIVMEDRCRSTSHKP